MKIIEKDSLAMVFFLLLGMLFTYKAISSIKDLIYIQKRGIDTIGKILSYKSDEDGYKIPIIEFETLEGKLIKKEPFYYTSTDLDKISTYKNYINKNVSIVYDVKNPEKFIIKTDNHFNYATLLFAFIVGLVSIIIAICAF